MRARADVGRRDEERRARPRAPRVACGRRVHLLRPDAATPGHLDPRERDTRRRTASLARVMGQLHWGLSEGRRAAHLSRLCTSRFLGIATGLLPAQCSTRTGAASLRLVEHRRVRRGRGTGERGRARGGTHRRSRADPTPPRAPALGPTHTDGRAARRGRGALAGRALTRRSRRRKAQDDGSARTRLGPGRGASTRWPGTTRASVGGADGERMRRAPGRSLGASGGDGARNDTTEGPRQGSGTASHAEAGPLDPRAPGDRRGGRRALAHRRGRRAPLELRRAARRPWRIHRYLKASS